MLEKFSSINARDYHQRYEGTYGFFTSDSNVRTLVKLNRVVSDADDRPFIDFVDALGANYRLLADADRGFEFIPPKSSWYNTSNGAVFVQRIAQRQWTRGVSRRNTQIYLLTEDGLTAVPVDFPYLTEIYAKETPVEFQKLKATGKSFALSSQIAVHLPTNQLLILGQPSGKVSLDTSNGTDVFHVSLSSPELWQTEINDVFKRNNLTVKIA